LLRVWVGHLEKNKIQSFSIGIEIFMLICVSYSHFHRKDHSM
jgi:hypothetical protein